MEREAELAALACRKPSGWSNEVYGQMGEYAHSRGLDPELFKTITNPAVIEMFHD